MNDESLVKCHLLQKINIIHKIIINIEFHMSFLSKLLSQTVVMKSQSFKLSFKNWLMHIRSVIK